jgi:hypothetical protein
MSLIHTPNSSLQHILSLLSALLFHKLSGNGFQCRRFLNFHVHVLTGWRLSHNYPSSKLVLTITPSMDCTENTSPNSSSIVVSCCCCTDRVENIALWLVHWCLLGICCLATGIVYSHYIAASQHATILTQKCLLSFISESSVFLSKHKKTTITIILSPVLA